MFLSILITPFTANLSKFELLTQAALLPTSLKEIQVVLRHIGPIQTAPKKNKLMSKVRQKKVCKAFQKALQEALKGKLWTEITLIILPSAFCTLESSSFHHANSLQPAWPKSRTTIPDQNLLRIKGTVNNYAGTSNANRDWSWQTVMSISPLKTKLSLKLHLTTCYLISQEAGCPLRFPNPTHLSKPAIYCSFSWKVTSTESTYLNGPKYQC